MRKKVMVLLAVVSIVTVPLFAKGCWNKAKAAAAPAPAATFTFYKGDAVAEGSEITKLDLKVGEELTVTVKAVGADGKELTGCPVWSSAPKAYLQLTKVPDKCASEHIKALKAAKEVFLKATIGKESGTLKGTITAK